MAFTLPPAHADNSEIMDGEDTVWMEQAPQQGTWSNQPQSQYQPQNNARQMQPQAWNDPPQFAAPPADFQCPSGWSCTPKVAQKKQEEKGCTSRFSRCYRKKMGYGGGGGDD